MNRTGKVRAWVTEMRFAPLLTMTCLAGPLFGQTLPSTQQSETVLDSIAHVETGPLRGVPAVPRPDSTVEMPLQRGRIPVRAGFLHVQEHGSGTPLVLIPGGPGNTLQSFHPHFSRAARFARVIYYDLRGTGQSSWTPESGYTAEQAVADLDRLRVGLGIDRWIVLGHSFGGLLAQLYAIYHPQHTAGLVLVSSSEAFAADFGDSDGRAFMLPGERARVREIYTRNGASVVPVHSATMDLATMRLLVYNALRNGDWKRQYFRRPTDVRMAQIATHEWLHDLDFNRLLNQSGFRYRLDGAFTEMPISCLIIEGRWDPTWSAGKPRSFAKHFPTCRLLVLERSSHFAFADEPDRFFPALERFVQKIGLPTPKLIEQWERKIEHYRFSSESQGK
ncbi:MAG TPA: alpha/beta hydrolase [Gemmatimonadales bacterium]|nr:alpha/beta hydrolase [Gemmatimonadales bacterium]